MSFQFISPGADTRTVRVSNGLLNNGLPARLPANVRVSRRFVRTWGGDTPPIRSGTPDVRPIRRRYCRAALQRFAIGAPTPANQRVEPTGRTIPERSGVRTGGSPARWATNTQR